MQSHYQKCLQSQHKMLLSSISRDFILKKRSTPQDYPRLSVRQNEIYITYHNLPADQFRTINFEPETFRMIIHELTKR